MVIERSSVGLIPTSYHRYHHRHDLRRIPIADAEDRFTAGFFRTKGSLVVRRTHDCAEVNKHKRPCNAVAHKPPQHYCILPIRWIRTYHRSSVEQRFEMRDHKKIGMAELMNQKMYQKRQLYK